MYNCDSRVRKKRLVTGIVCLRLLKQQLVNAKQREGASLITIRGDTRVMSKKKTITPNRRAITVVLFILRSTLCILMPIFKPSSSTVDFSSQPQDIPPLCIYMYIKSTVYGPIWFFHFTENICTVRWDVKRAARAVKLSRFHFGPVLIESRKIEITQPALPRGSNWQTNLASSGSTRYNTINLSTLVLHNVHNESTNTVQKNRKITKLYPLMLHNIHNKITNKVQKNRNQRLSTSTNITQYS